MHETIGESAYIAVSYANLCQQGVNGWSHVHQSWIPSFYFYASLLGLVFIVL